MQAADWTNQLTAVYTFENETDVGACTSEAALSMLPMGDVASVTTPEPPQGERVLSISSATSFLNVSSDAFAGSQAGLTYGGWFNINSAVSQNVDLMGFADGLEQGWDMTRGNGARVAKCHAYAASGVSDVDSTGDPFDKGSWHHFVCRVNRITPAVVEVLGRGIPLASDDLDAFDEGSGAFRVGDVLNRSAESFRGEADEVFFSAQPLSDASILRIWACGIDGSLCRCEPEMPEEYEYCGRLLMQCGELPDCDGPPETL